MKNIILAFILFIVALSANAQWYYGGGEAINLENQIGFDKHTQKIKTGEADDPSSVAKTGGAGSLYLRTNGELYRKTDAGSSTNWKRLVDAADALVVHANRTALDAVTGTNTGDETQATIKTKLGAATSLVDGYLTSGDWSTFNNKITTPITCGEGQHVALVAGTYSCVDASVSAGQASNYFFIDSASGVASYLTLSKVPSTAAEEIDSISLVADNTETQYAGVNGGYADGAIGYTSIAAGFWSFNMYRYVNATAGTTELRIKVYSRTTGGVETLLFTVTTGDINDTASTLQTIRTVQPAFVVNSTDVVVVKLFGITTAQPKTVTFIHNGAARNSFIESPITTKHNDLLGLNSGDYQHLSAAQKTVATQAATSSVNGYLTSTDWSTFNGKQATLLAKNGTVLSPSTSGDSIASTGSITAASFTNNDKDNFIADGGFELGIGAFTCSVGTCTSDTATVAQGSKSLKIVTANQTASVTFSACNTAYANRDLGVTIEMKSDLATAQLCGFTPAGNQNCALVPSINAWNRVPTYVTADANGCYGMNISTSGTSTGTIFSDMASISTNPFVYKNLANVTDWTSLTYTQVNALAGNQGLGTFSAGSYEYRREGTDLLIRGRLTAGTTSASEIRIPLPYAGISIASTAILPATQVAGSLNTGSQQATSYSVLIAPSSTYFNVGYWVTGATNAIAPSNGDIFASGTVLSFTARIPITGWKAESEFVITPIKTNIEEWSISQASNTLADLSAEIQFDADGTFSKNGLTASYDGANPIKFASAGLTNNLIYTTDGKNFYSSKPVKVILSFSGVIAAADRKTQIWKNGVVVAFGQATSSTNLDDHTSAEITLNGTTDYFNVGTNDSTINGANAIKLTILAIASDAQALGALPIPKVAYLKDVKTNGTAAGTATGGIYQKRTLTNVEGDFTIVSLDTSTSSFTLPSGEYFIEAKAPAWKTNAHKIKLRNYTDSLDQLIGMSAYQSINDSVQSLACLEGKVTLTSAKVFSIQHFITTTSNTEGLGIAVSAGDSEIYTTVKITKYK